MPNHSTSEAEQAMNEESAIDTDREAFDYLSHKHGPNRCLSGKDHKSIVDLLRQAEGDFDFNPPRLGDDFASPAKFD
jgi:hypothetical protein